MKFSKSKNNFLKLLATFTFIMLPWLFALIYNLYFQKDAVQTQVPLQNYKVDTLPVVDHSKFEILKQKFDDPRQLTEACLTCHNMTAKDFMKSPHWTWLKKTINKNGDTVDIGKKNIMNNFCIGIPSNWGRCTSCHAGYGWKDKNFDFHNPKNIDCIVCHDRTGTYKKFPAGAGYPVKEKTVFGGKTYLPPDYNLIAANVGKPTRENCGVCHFTGGGGNNVKHGDIANELKDVTKEVDVHMGVDGKNMSCIECHKTDRHIISGQLYSVSSHNKNRVTCQQCHTDKPHVNQTLNRHINRVACQTCHIPTYAKVNATKMHWDWSTAGKFNEDGSMKVEKDSAGNMTYHTMKGNFVWEKNVTPEYVWFNGNAEHYHVGEKVDTIKPIQINKLIGSYSDSKSKITPVKVHRGKQIYDPVNKTLIMAHLFGKDSTAYWKNFDWNKAAQTGMKTVGLPYSGNYTFARTEMYWPINHMVAPKGESLTCAECHSHNSKLAGLNTFYLAGRDKSNIVDNGAILLIIFALIAVLIHTSLRIINRKKV